jgi:signal transduction histidine kinase
MALSLELNENGDCTGLSVCRSIVEKHYGKILVDSDDHRGLGFRFEVQVFMSIKHQKSDTQ